MSPQDKTIRRRLRWPLAVCVLLGTLALGGSQTASGEGQILIRGADSGSHLRVTMDGDHIVVNGYMSADEPSGCGFTHFRTTAVCSASSAGSIVFEMGPAGDKVEIIDPMPLPVTVYMGDGSDKFIGNSEPDTCYPQGARRNRCYGGAGNDICITGPRNSDCVGDGGDDYAQFSTGSDGCWGDFSPVSDDPRTGTPGNDVCMMGSGKDGAHGGPGDDALYEGSGSGKLYGQGGDDRLYGGGGADKLYGGGGRDYCNGQGATGKSIGCETGPGH
jgi:Ca2+-binding RTX toxin-like protein